MHNTDIFKIDLTDCFSDFPLLCPSRTKSPFVKNRRFFSLYPFPINTFRARLPSPPSLCPSLLSGLFAFPIFFPLPFPIFVFCRRFLFHRDLFTFQAHQLSGSPFLALLPDAPAPLRFFTLSRHSSDTCLLSRHFSGTCLVPPTRHDFSAHKKDSVCIRQRSLKG